MQILSKKQVHEGLALLNPRQQDYILHNENQSKKSKWLEVLARNKGISKGYSIGRIREFN